METLIQKRTKGLPVQQDGVNALNPIYPAAYNQKLGQNTKKEKKKPTMKGPCKVNKTRDTEEESKHGKATHMEVSFPFSPLFSCTANEPNAGTQQSCDGGATDGQLKCPEKSFLSRQKDQEKEPYYLHSMEENLHSFVFSSLFSLIS